MNRRTCLKTGTMAVVAASFGVSTAGAKTGMIGKMPSADYKKMNTEAGAKVEAIKADGKSLSKGDAALLNDIAVGGMMQLEVSRVAVKMATSEDVRTIAQAEVEEQTILSAKLKEFAKAGGVDLPKEPDATTKEMVAKLKAKSGAEFDKSYLEESGVEGHKQLKATMSRVREKAEDAAIKSLATTALPLIESHLQVSQDEMAELG